MATRTSWRVAIGPGGRAVSYRHTVPETEQGASLATGEARVLALDFKSNRTEPERPEDVPEGILRQMGAYRAALGAIWTDRRVEMAVIWTRTARLMPLPDALVDAALARAADLDPGGARP